VIDLGISKMALIGVVALVVIGPEKLPAVARTLGAWIGKAQRYVADAKSEVNRSMDLEELKKMKDSVENAARDVQSSVQTASNEFEKDWADTTAQLTGESWAANVTTPVPEYQNPKKKNGASNAARRPIGTKRVWVCVPRLCLAPHAWHGFAPV